MAVKVNAPVINIHWLIYKKEHFICTVDEKNHCITNDTVQILIKEALQVYHSDSSLHNDG